MCQFTKFGIVGFSNTIIFLLVYYVLIFFKVNYLIANAIGFIISVINAYYWNSKYVFKKKEHRNHKIAFIKVFSSYFLTFLLSTLFLIIMVKYMDISNTIAPIINLCITIPLNFLLNKVWAMK
ncbi:GtrA family protein [Clostridioides sp. ZZV14-6345]|uniref:GtrA family protein n=1 Tax=Clostridioides sp. ZZV14-6345 TaxID=2811496 RepID=UPI001D12D5CD|nr:GtrA family protein [Clostridioides sp. ZZV14-6345]